MTVWIDDVLDYQYHCTSNTSDEIAGFRIRMALCCMHVYNLC